MTNYLLMITLMLCGGIGAWVHYVDEQRIKREERRLLLARLAEFTR